MKSQVRYLECKVANDGIHRPRPGVPAAAVCGVGGATGVIYCSLARASHATQMKPPAPRDPRSHRSAQANKPYQHALGTSRVSLTDLRPAGRYAESAGAASSRTAVDVVVVGLMVYWVRARRM
jgi:hypothetical protein